MKSFVRIGLTALFNTLLLCGTAHAASSLAEIKFTPQSAGAITHHYPDLKQTIDEKQKSDAAVAGGRRLMFDLATVKLAHKPARLVILRAESSLECGAKDCATAFFKAGKTQLKPIADLATDPAAPLYYVDCGGQKEFLVINASTADKTQWAYWQIEADTMTRKTTNAALSQKIACH